MLPPFEPYEILSRGFGPRPTIALRASRTRIGILILLVFITPKPVFVWSPRPILSRREVMNLLLAGNSLGALIVADETTWSGGDRRRNDRMVIPEIEEYAWNRAGTSEEVKGYQYGCKTDPVRIASLKEVRGMKTKSNL